MEEKQQSAERLSFPMASAYPNGEHRVQRRTQHELEYAELAAERNGAARWVGGWGVFLLIIGTIGGIGLLMTALLAPGVMNRPLWFVAGVVLLCVSFWMRALNEWLCHLLLTLGRLEDYLKSIDQDRLS